MAVAGVLLQLVIFRRMEGQDLRQTLVTIGLSIVLADLMKWQWGAEIYQLTSPTWLVGFTELPFVRVVSGRSPGGPGHRDRDRPRPLAVPQPHDRGHDDPRRVDDRAMLACSGVNVQLVFAVTFAIGGRPWRDSPESSAAPPCRFPRAMTPTICWPRWSWSSSAAWAA